MRKYAAANLDMLQIVAYRLGSLNEKVVYLGGCATALLITDPVALDVRPTIDVDCIVDIAALEQYKTVVAGRSEIIEEVRLANSEVQNYLKETFETLLKNEQFSMALPGHLNDGPTSVVARRVEIVIERLSKIIVEAKNSSSLPSEVI